MAGSKEVPWKDLDPGIIPVVKILVAAGLKTEASCQGGPGHPAVFPYIVLENPGNEECIRLLAAEALINAGIHGFTVSQEYMYQKEWAAPWYKAVIRIEFWKLRPHEKD
jgi:hypothetical protein